MLSIPELDGKKYAVIYADPPWHFAKYSGIDQSRSAENHYPTMKLDDIKAIPVLAHAAADCTLLLWTTDSHLERALEVIRAWGFTYKTVGFYWAKQNQKSPGWFTGMGFWTRANPEQCLLATRGRPKRLAKDVPKLIVSPRREHSRKPDEAYERIERLVDGPYLEMFARATRPGWDAWGNQCQLAPPWLSRGDKLDRRECHPPSRP
jgi:N6-adenosine-specific RNA methylase IME4